MGEVIFLGIISLVAISMALLAYQFPVSIIDKSGGPAFFPQAVVLFIVALALIRIVQVIRTKKDERKEFVFLEMFKGPRLIFILATIIEIATMKYLGFIISMSIYLAGMIIYFNYTQKGKWLSVKNMLLIAFISILGIIGIDFIFCEVLKVVIPKGLIGF